MRKRQERPERQGEMKRGTQKDTKTQRKVGQTRRDTGRNRATWRHRKPGFLQAFHFKIH